MLLIHPDSLPQQKAGEKGGLKLCRVFWGFHLGTQKRSGKEQKQLDISEEVHDDLVWRDMEYPFVPPFSPGPGPKLLNFCAGVCYALCQTEIEVPESQC
jgi:hypothetical protein